MLRPLPNPADRHAVRAWLADRRPDPEAVKQWAARRIPAAGHGPVPAAGTPAWSALDDHDPRKAAAIVRAALAWADERTPEATAKRVHADLDHDDHVRAAFLKDMTQDLSGAADWSRIAEGPTARRLAEYRARPGRNARPVDRYAAQVWARTGITSTTVGEVAA